MKREELIRKWLDNELNPKELSLFKELDDYTDLIRISEGVQKFKPTSFHVTTELENLKNTIALKKQKRNWLKPVYAIAASVVVLFGIYYSFLLQETTVTTLASQKQEITLPDNSNVSLNSLSSLSFDEKNWDKQREVELQGEAFFKVEKGATFNVKTETGLVTVVGTQFIVKDRAELFEVVCYEGAVRVNHNGQSILLKQGDSYIKMEGTTASQTKTTQLSPSWITNTSTFKSLPYSTVIAEFERQYDIQIIADHIDSKQLFTGSFIHNDIEIALKSITLPLNLEYTRTNQTITLKGE
ncbi:FecR domain-containing protein [uncultured Dokdonia sp.]|uniref:FecR family protein n=1 Tax=uncultured Dokdonia sp. TaxID=575653 RepID=UPI00260B3A6E|nr:FecR domain-containing protein [uncultured Dokdonia sp.]